jgi:DNA-binding NarL/FixJ family response regulator
MKSISVFLADWQVLFREGIHFTLSGEEDINVIGEATSNDEALSFIEANTPDIAVLNTNHSEFSGINLTRHISRNTPSVSVILITDNENTDTYLEALYCGASACITKNISPDEIVELIRKIAAGSKPISEALIKPEVATRIIQEFDNFSSLNKEVDNLLASLSGIEGKILQSAADGNQIEQISTSLEINTDAIYHHLDTILTKLISNNHDREIIEVAQRKITAILTRTRHSKKEPDYVQRDEFDAFKESIKERFQTIMNELG